MIKKPQLTLLTTTLTSLILLTSGCGLNMKPDNSQVYENFHNRRAPKENQLLVTGSYDGGSSDDKSQRSSHFTPYTGKVVSSNKANQNKADQNKANNNAVNDEFITNSKTNPPENNLDGKANFGSSDSSNNGSFFNRLKQKISSNSALPIPQEKFQVARSTPSLNNAGTDDLGALEQGDRVGPNQYSYYDVADPIPSKAYVSLNDSASSPSLDNVQLADARGASAPLVNVPEMSTIDGMKSRVEEEEVPHLKNVPPKPVELKQTIKRILPVAHSTPKPVERLNKSHHYNSDADDSESRISSTTKPDAVDHHYSDYNIKDPTAKIVVKPNGEAILTGTMGSLKR